MPPKRKSTKQAGLGRRKRNRAAGACSVDGDGVAAHVSQLTPEAVGAPPTTMLHPAAIAALSKAVATAVKQSLQDAGVQPSPRAQPGPPGAANTQVPQNSPESVVTSLVAQAVASTLENVTAGGLTTSSAGPEGPSNQVLSVHSVPLATGISERVRAKIWANEYVDLSTLMTPNSLSEENYTLKVQTGEDGKPNLAVVSTEKRRSIKKH